MIFFENWNLRVDGQVIAQQFDHLTRSITVVGHIPEGWDWVLLVQMGAFMDLIPLTEKEGALYTILTAQQLSIAGYYKVQLRGTRGEQVKHTNAINIYISASLSGDQKWPEVPSEFTELERRSAESAKEAKAAAITAQSSAEEAKSAADHTGAAKTAVQEAVTNAVKSANNAAASEQAAAEHRAGAEKAAQEAEGYASQPPTIGENGNWWLWNGAGYVDSGASSRGDMTRTQGNHLYANALKGMASGACVRLDDISVLEHNMSVKLSSKNRMPYPYNNTTKTINGITFTDNGDGTITANGTATADANFSCHWWDTCSIPAGVYTFWCSTVSGVTRANFALRKNGVTLVDINETGTPINVELKDNADAIYVVLRVIKGVTVENFVFKPQLERGTTATAYAPYVSDLTAVTVDAKGKNLCPTVGITTEESSSGSVIINTSGHGTYTLSGDVTKYSDDEATDTRITIRFYYTDGTFDEVKTAMDKEFAECDGVTRHKVVTASTDSRKTLQYIKIYTLDYTKSPGIRNAKAENIQLELSDADTGYEPYVAPVTYVPAADGVCEIASIAPTMSLLTDNPNVVMECEYNRDINKAFEQLTQAIISMGGNV